MVYGVLRGFDNEAHRFAVYRGFVELGRQFRVSDMPNSLEDFDAHWAHLVENTLADSDSATVPDSSNHTHNFSSRQP